MTDALDTGMASEEAVRRASDWWQRVGRHQCRQTSNWEEIGRTVGKGIVITGDQQPVLRSGILIGQPWEELSRDEQRRIVKAWHHEFVRVPQMEGAVI